MSNSAAHDTETIFIVIDMSLSENIYLTVGMCRHPQANIDNDKDIGEGAKFLVDCKHYCITFSASSGKELGAGVGWHVVSEFILICFSRLTINYSKCNLSGVLFIGKDKLTGAGGLPAFGSANSLKAKVMTAQLLLRELRIGFESGAMVD